jgi:hypothetical protein
MPCGLLGQPAGITRANAAAALLHLAETTAAPDRQRILRALTRTAARPAVRGPRPHADQLASVLGIPDDQRRQP